MAPARPRRVAPPNLFSAPDADTAGPDSAAAAWADRQQAARCFARYAGRIAPADRQRMRVTPTSGPDAGKFPRRAERALTAELPGRPAAVMLFDRAGYARTVVFDLDAKRVGRRQVDTDVAALTTVLRACRVPWLRDASVSGGQHVYVPLATPRHVSDIGRLLRAAKTLLPSLDLSLANAGEGCIRPPGSPHRYGGYQRLLCPQEQADRAFAAPATDQAWTLLYAALTASHRHPNPLAQAPAVPADRLAGRSWTPLPDRYETIARSGDPSGYASGSEARFAVLCSAVQRGWSLDDVTARLDDGRWSGLDRLYARYRGGARRALRRDWAKALRWAQTAKKRAGTDSLRSVSVPDTSFKSHRGAPGGTTESKGTAERNQIGNEWLSTFLDVVANASPRWGSHAGRNRAVLQALAYAAWQTRSRLIHWGVRSYALGGAVGRSTVAVVLAELAAEPDPFLTRVAARVADQADTYQLQLPENVSLRRAGPTPKPRPVPDVLIDRPKSGFGVYQALSSRPRNVDDLVERSRYRRATVYRRLAELVDLGLARRTRDGCWIRGPRGLVAAAWRTGAYWLRTRRHRRYRQERQAWRDHLDGWQRPAALIPPPRTPDDPPAPPPSQNPSAPADRPAAPAAPPCQRDDWQHDEPPDDPWPDQAPDTPDVPWEMILELLEEVLGAVPIDEQGRPLYRRHRRR